MLLSVWLVWVRFLSVCLLHLSCLVLFSELLGSVVNLGKFRHISSNTSSVPFISFFPLW